MPPMTRSCQIVTDNRGSELNAYIVSAQLRAVKPQVCPAARWPNLAVEGRIVFTHKAAANVERSPYFGIVLFV
jgi:hypothetical protein